MQFCSFNNPFAVITSLSKLYFRLRRFILLVQTKKIYFYGLWQQHKQLKTMEVRESWPGIYDEGYIHQFQPEPTRVVLIEWIAIPKCNLIFHCCNAKEISFYYFCNTKLCVWHKKTHVNSIYTVVITFLK